MKRKLMFLILVAIVAVLTYLYLRPTLAVLSVDRVYNVTEVGQTVLVNVTLSNVPGCSGWLMNLSWDPYYVQLTPGEPASRGAPPVEVREGPFFKAGNMSTVFVFNSLDTAKGEMILGDIFMRGGDYVNGTGVILTINFTILRVGSSTIELNPATVNATQSIIADSTNNILDHAEVNGLITNEGPPPVWAATDFQTTLIYGEIAVLGVASGIIYWRAHPRPPKSAKKRAELQPIVDPNDQLESD